MRIIDIVTSYKTAARINSKEFNYLNENIEHFTAKFPNECVSVFWYLNHPNPKLRLKISDIYNMSQPVVSALISPETLSLVTNPDFPFSIKELCTITSEGLKGLLDKEIIELVLAGKVKSLPVLNRLKTAIAAKRLEQQQIHMPTQHDSDEYATEMEPVRYIAGTVLRPIRLISVNGQESIHNSNTNLSVAASFVKLDDLYNRQLNRFDLLNVLANIHNWCHTLPKDNPKTVIIKNAIKRLTTHHDYKSYACYIDNLTVIKALSLTWIAIHDDKYRINSSAQGLTDAITRFEEALIGIECKDLPENLTDLDLSQYQNPACHMSIHNRLAIALNGVHQSVNVIFISEVEAATLTLQSLVMQYSKEYLLSIKKQQPLEITEIFNSLCAQPELIYHKIQDKVAAELIKKHPLFFISSESQLFKDFVATGVDIDISGIITQINTDKKDKLAIG